MRFDDFGSGMDEQIVRDHLLKVGSSYYNSAQYRADVLRASKGAGSDFVPISRFGIGLLSCFIMGDRVEISTLRQLPDGSRATPVRLSLDGLHGFFTVQTPDLAPKEMPSGRVATGEEAGYRTEPGTSIAVRLDPRKEREPLDLKTVLESYIICPPVPVEFDGARIGGDPKELLESPWCERTTIPLKPEQLQQIASFMELALSPSDLQWELRPLDLTAHSHDMRRIRGQLVVWLRSIIGTR
ncbi:MAG TPA: hypothetical protein VHG52_09475 [Thermomicrobiales bacterium]|nr:hypothetical protein [Thermomicrobiales bacterium]